MTAFEESNVQKSLMYDGVYRPLEYFQRDYEWEVGQGTQDGEVRMLFNDIEDAFESDPEHPYFIGNFVLAEDGDDYLVVDGLQRSVTIYILLSAMRDRFRDLSKRGEFRDHVVEIENLLFLDNDPSEPVAGKTCRLQLPGENGKFLERIARGDHVGPRDVDTVAKRRLYRARKEAGDWLEYMTGESGAEGLKKLKKYVLKLDVINEKNTSADGAVDRFVSLNTRGKQLSHDALVKTAFLSAVDDDAEESEGRRKEIAEAWHRITANLTRKSGDKYTVSPAAFLRHFVMSRGVQLQKTSVYRWFATRTRSSNGSKPLDVSDIERASEIFRDVRDGRAAKEVMGISQFGRINSQCTPCIIAIVTSDLKPEDKKDLLKLLVRLGFMTCVGHYDITMATVEACGFLAGNGKYAERVEGAKLVLRNKIHARRQEFSQRMQAQQFRINAKEFVGAKEYAGGKTAFLLRTLAYGTDGAMPKGDWVVEYVGSDRDKRLGNFVLVRAEDVPLLKGKSFAEKQEIYKDVPCALTSSLAKPLSPQASKHYLYVPPTRWGDKEITERTRAMVGLAEYLMFDVEDSHAK